MVNKNKQKEKHVPQRLCVVCRKKFPKKELMRFVWVDAVNSEANETSQASKKGALTLDTSGKLRGRGLNMCADLVTFDEAVQRGHFNRFVKKSIEKENLAIVRESVVKYVETKRIADRGQKTIRVSGTPLKM